VAPSQVSIVQGIEHVPPKNEIQVRVLLETPISP
jgi:hypothetical protein